VVGGRDEAMKEAIKILEQELAYYEANRGECPKNDDYFEGYVESLKSSIAFLTRCEIESK